MKKKIYTLTKKMMPGRHFTTGATAALRGLGLTKSHSDPYRTEREGLQGDMES